MSSDTTETFEPSGDSPVKQTWTCLLRGVSYELDVYPSREARLVLRVDGKQIYDKKNSTDNRSITVGRDCRVRVRLSFLGRVKDATAYDGDAELDFDAPVGSRAEKTQSWGRKHPVLFALRHVAFKAGGILIAFLGVTAFVKWLLAPVIEWIADHMPRISWPEIHLPQIPWPEIHLPRIPWPDIQIPWPQITLPWWLQVVLGWLAEHEEIIKPLLIGLLLALGEMRRQRKQRKQREAGVADDPNAELEKTRFHRWLDQLDARAADTPMARRKERAKVAAALRALENKRRAQEQASVGSDDSV
ncbi:Uncharacterised protein [Dermatophilus congolensis]|uniref:Uncharacterized protein n=1 Tax=Dermatophilus congolensis TaxID=1863 RepID=A0A239V7S9_9MICO|nr:Uncharacterised protein [Dermatophilus congolensis]